MNGFGNLGEISLADYRKVSKARKRGRGLLRAAGLLVLFLACTAAGDFTGLWTGKHAKDLSFADGVRFLSDPNARPFEVEAGMMLVNREGNRALQLLSRAARREDKAGEYASVYLSNIAKKTIEDILGLASVGPHEERQRKNLEILRRALR